MSLIRLRDVSKRFGRRSVPRNVFFRLEEGARVGLIGNNGSGKTTVLRMILGREDPSEGQIERDEELRTGPDTPPSSPSSVTTCQSNKS